MAGAAGTTQLDGGLDTALESLRGRLSAAEFDAIQKGAQRDITRARQKDRQEIDEIKTVVGQMQQALQGNTASQQKPLYEEVLQQKGVTKETAPKMHDFQIANNEAVIAEATRRITGQLAQQLTPMFKQQQDQQLAQERSRLKAEYGDEVDRLWPDMEREARGRLARGHGIRRMEDVLEDLDPSAYRELVYKAEHRRRSTQRQTVNKQTTEGFAVQHRNQAVTVDGGGDTKNHAVKAGYDYDDILRITQETLGELGIGK